MSLVKMGMKLNRPGIIFAIILVMLSNEAQSFAIKLPYGTASSPHNSNSLKQLSILPSQNKFVRITEKTAANNGYPYHLIDHFKASNARDNSLKRSKLYPDYLTQKRQRMDSDETKILAALEEIGEIDDLANGILFDLKTILQDEHNEAGHSELASKFGKAVGQERLLRLS